MESGRLGIDLICILDISGSMSGGKLDQCKSTLLFIIDSLQSKDRFALCLFSSDASRKIKLTVCSDENKVALVNAI